MENVVLMVNLQLNLFFQLISLIERENNISSFIHKTALVGQSVDLGENVKIGPYSVIENDVIIGDNTEIGNHVTICANTTIGRFCKIFHCSSIGEVPQDLKFEGEETQTIIGDRTKIREYVTINRGTKAQGETRIGSDCLLMASTHIAHDCILGDNVIMSNLSTLGGHVILADYVILGGGVLVHQFTKIGSNVFIGGGFRVVQDVPPFILAAGSPLNFKGINSVGLKRRGFSVSDRKTIKSIYHIYFKSGLNREDSLKKIDADVPDSKIKKQIIDFIHDSDRGII